MIYSVLLLLVGWVALMVTASLLAVIPFFIVAAIGKLWEMAGERRKTPDGEKAGQLRTEEQIWHESGRSHASIFESPAESLRRAG